MSNPSMRLDCDNEPRLTEGDRLVIQDDWNGPYRATVREVGDDQLTVSLQIPSPYGFVKRTTHTYTKLELETAHVNGRLIINPPKDKIAGSFP